MPRPYKFGGNGCSCLGISSLPALNTLTGVSPTSVIAPNSTRAVEEVHSKSSPSSNPNYYLHLTLPHTCPHLTLAHLTQTIALTHLTQMIALTLT